MPLLCKEFGTITIDIRDDTGRPVPFERGKVTVTLPFRHRKSGSTVLMNYNDYYARQSGGALPYFVGVRWAEPLNESALTSLSSTAFCRRPYLYLFYLNVFITSFQITSGTKGAYHGITQCFLWHFSKL